MSYTTIRFLSHNFDSVTGNAVNLQASFEYIDSGALGSLEHIARFDDVYYSSWCGIIKELVWSSYPNTGHAEWVTVNECPQGLIHLPDGFKEGQFKFSEKQQECDCSLDKLMVAGCGCGGE